VSNRGWKRQEKGFSITSHEYLYVAFCYPIVVASGAGAAMLRNKRWI
jgi:hypothetical protein